MQTAPIRSSGQTFAQRRPCPCRMEPRMPRRAYVAGDSFDSHCIQAGSTETG